MGYFEDLVSRFFPIAEDAIGESAASYQMQKGEQIDVFLSRLKEIRDQLTSIGATPDQDLMVRTALNAVFEDWETFVQSILGKTSLTD